MPKTETPVARDHEVECASRLSAQLIVEAERLTHRLHVHLDEVQTFLAERKSRESPE